MATPVRWGLVDALDAWRGTRPLPGRLVVIPPGGLGDNLLAVAALRRLMQAAPRMHVTWIGRRAYIPLMAASGVHACVASEDLPAGVLDLAPVEAVLCYADVPGDFLGAREAVARIPLRIGPAAARRRPSWFTDLVHTARFGRPAHEVLRHLRMLRPFGLDATPSPAALVDEGTITPAAAALPEDLPRSGFVLLHPFSAGHAREWPVAHWAEAARRLLAQGRVPVFTGSSAEGDRLAAAWPRAQRPPGIVEAFGRLDLAQMATLIARSDGLVACSTGPLHLAAALGAPTLGLYVPRKGLGVARWAALGRRAVSVQVGAACRRRCKNDGCHCIAALDPARIVDALAGDRIRTEALAGWQVVAPPRTTSTTATATTTQETR